MTQQTVIQSTAYAEAITRLNAQSQAQLAITIANRMQTAHTQLSSDVTNRMNALQAMAEEALRKSDLLEDGEKAQLEDAFIQFLTTSGMESLLAAMSITLGGVPYTVDSVLKSLVNADRVIQENNDYDASTGMISQKTYTLHDGRVCLMAFTQENLLGLDGIPTGDIRFNGACADWRNGMPAYEHFVLRPIREDMNIMGSLYTHTKDYQLLEKRNVVLDITAQLVEAQALTSAAPDLNADGVVGILAADPAAEGVTP